MASSAHGSAATVEIVSNHGRCGFQFGIGAAEHSLTARLFRVSVISTPARSRASVILCSVAARAETGFRPTASDGLTIRLPLTRRPATRILGRALRAGGAPRTIVPVCRQEDERADLLLYHIVKMFSFPHCCGPGRRRRSCTSATPATARPKRPPERRRIFRTNITCGRTAPLGHRSIFLTKSPMGNRQTPCYSFGPR
jgi:hypothetical protein